MADQRIIKALRTMLQAPLPGWDAQRSLMPEGRDALPPPDNLHPAAVLIALYSVQDEWHFPLIKRSTDGFAHSGQIALPGGRQEGSETDIETALREAEEEVNLSPTQIQIIGKTSPLPIPVSRHLVQPVVGFTLSHPEFHPDPREVAQIFSVSISSLRDLEIKFEDRRFKERLWTVPYFEIQGHKVWGATAMILSEFKEVISKII